MVAALMGVPWECRGSWEFLGGSDAVMVTPRRERYTHDSGSDSAVRLNLSRPEWMDSALCHGRTDLDFFGEGKASIDAALQVCGRCAVMTPCREYALADPDLVGVWGGATTTARRAMRSARQLRKQSPHLSRKEH